MVANLTHLETAPDTTLHTLVVTGADPVAIQMLTVNGQSVNIRRANLQTIHEEADIIVVQQAINVSQAGGTGVQIMVRADDTDIVVFLLHFYDKLDCSSTIWNLLKKVERNWTFNQQLVNTSHCCQIFLQSMHYQRAIQLLHKKKMFFSPFMCESQYCGEPP